ncbi:hypothetical protein ACWDX6_07710 [Streptomyces sp. NPDC003027]
MEEARLSPRERRILAEIERELREDAPREPGPRTTRRARGQRRGAGQPAGTHHGRRDRWDRRDRRDRLAALGTALSGALTLALLVSAVVTGAPVLVWAFAAVWVVTLVCLLRLVIHWSTKTRTKT